MKTHFLSHSKFLRNKSLFTIHRRTITGCKTGPGAWGKRGEKRPYPYVVVRANQKDYTDILKLMWQSYHPEEPTTASIGLGDKRNACLDEEAMKVLAEGKTLVAKCKYTGCIAGACLNSVSTPWDPALRDELACSVRCPKVRQLFHFWAHLQRAPNIYKTFCTENVFELSSLFVMRRARGKGVGRQLTEASKNLGLDCGYNVLRIDATNFYTGKIAEKAGFSLLHEVPYCSYVGADNRPVFNTHKPHKIVRIYYYAPYLNKKR